MKSFNYKEFTIYNLTLEYWDSYEEEKSELV
jgi:hypothetical protein